MRLARIYDGVTCCQRLTAQSPQTPGPLRQPKPPATAMLFFSSRLNRKRYRLGPEATILGSWAAHLLSRMRSARRINAKARAHQDRTTQLNAVFATLRVNCLFNKWLCWSGGRLKAPQLRAVPVHSWISLIGIAAVPRRVSVRARR